MRSSLKLVAAGGVAVVALVLLWAPLASTQTAIQPFTVRSLTISQDGGGFEVRRFETAVARDSAGSTVELREPAPGADLPNRIVVDRVAGTRTAIDTLTESKTTYLNADAVTPAFNRDCPAGSETQFIRGVEAFAVREVRTLGGSGRTIEIERWVAPALGCITLQGTTTQRTHDSIVSVERVELISVSFDDPDPALFAIPESYVERAPSQVLAEIERLLPELCGECTGASSSQSRAIQDDVYYKNRR